MLDYLKNIFVGFCISFIGSVPLGYLNVIGLQFYKNENINPVINYLFGVVVIETLVIYFTLKLASKIALRTEWKKAISLFTIFFLLILAFYFYDSNSNFHNNKNPFDSFTQFPFFTGLVLSSLNFAQIPFWFSWNLCLINQGFIKYTRNKISFYIVGASIGTFIGMLTLIIGLHKSILYSKKSIDLQSYIWIIFIALALFQVYTLYRDKKKSALL